MSEPILSPEQMKWYAEKLGMEFSTHPGGWQMIQIGPGCFSPEEGQRDPRFLLPLLEYLMDAAEGSGLDELDVSGSNLRDAILHAAKAHERIAEWPELLAALKPTP